MKRQIFLPVLLFGLFSLSTAFAEEQQEQNKFSGEISAQGTLTHVNGNEAKFNEYGDVRNGLYGDVKIKYDDDKYYVDFYSRNMLYDTQSYDLEGGKWGAYKFNINYSEIPHNFTYDAQTFYSGAGTNNLTYPTHTPSTNTGTWNTFDYSTKRKDYSAGFKLDVLKPFFLDFSAAIDERKGIYPIGAAGTNPGGISLELPAPIDYKTNSINLLAGYVRNPLFISLGYFYSNFTDSDTSLNFRNPATNNTASVTDTYSLPPDNQFYKINLKGALKLPLNSKFNVDLATADAKSDAVLRNSYVDDIVGGLRNITLSTPFFNGEVITNNIATSVTSKPLSFLDAKLFLKYDDRENKSDVITITDATQTPATFTNTLFNYRRVKYGTELGFQLPANFYFLGAYNHSTISREREDIPDNRDDLFSAELRWKGFDFLTARVGYERLDRRADFQLTDPTDIETFIRRFDAAGKSRNTYKANLDFFPADNFSISLGYKHRDTNYPDTVLGLTGDRGDEFLIDVDYLINKRIRLFGSFDYEYVRQDQFQRQTTGTVDPSLPPVPAAFNWTAAQKDENYSYAAGAEIFIVPEKLTLLLQYSYLQADGSVDYTYLLGANPLPAGRTQDNIDLSNWDGYKLTCVLIKLSYNVTKSLSVAAGYVYEKYDYNDAQYDGYQYVPAVTGTNGAYLTGAYNNPSYESNVGFMTVTYRF
ncbi:MAG: MtrB/PioB family decaheme-associated outer membrane protein [Smithellaceae bacterium]|jgi:MtrB/PioB family decaheme-associated outer membrane protein